MKIGQSKLICEPAAAQQVSGFELPGTLLNLSRLRSQSQLPDRLLPSDSNCLRFLSVCGWMGVGVRIQFFISQLSNQCFINKLSKLEVLPRCSEPGQEWVSKSCIQVQLSHVASRKLFLLLRVLPSLLFVLVSTFLCLWPRAQFLLQSQDDTRCHKMTKLLPRAASELP